MRWLRWVVPVVLVAAIGAVVYGNFNHSQSAGGASVAVRTARVQTGDVVLKVNAPGALSALQDAVVHARVGGQVVALLVKEGDRVKAGQVLLRQDDRDLAGAVSQAEQAAAQADSALAALERRASVGPQQTQASLAAADLSLRQALAGLTQQQQSARDRVERARLDLQSLRTREAGSVQPDQFTRDLQTATMSVQAAENDLKALDNSAANPSAAVFQVQSARLALERVALDARSSAVLPEERTAAVAAVASARQSLAAARQKLDDASLKAPFDGVVLNLLIKEGDPLVPGSNVLVLGAVDSVLARIRVDEVDIGTVSASQAVSVATAAYPGLTFTGQVRDVAAQASAVSPGQTGAAATFEVRAEIANLGGKLKPGMNVDSEISTLQARGVLVVGTESLIEKDAKKSVFVVEGGTVHERPVEVGVRARTQAEIKSGLQAGDLVVTGPFDALKKLKDGDRVKLEAPAAKP